MFEIMEALDMLQFFGGQRAGRELWADKPTDVQDADIESFNEKIKAIRGYIQHLEAERDATMTFLRGIGCDTCRYREVESWEEPCLYCIDYARWQWIGVQKEE